jgi:uncharacterized protein (TIGR02646 family)
MASYPERVERARALFASRNRPGDPVFGVVRGALDAMCRGPRRCMYCEDAPADEIEHFRPKDLYPDLAFAWRNYLYACGPCNGPKNNRFAVLARGNPRPLEVGRGRGEPAVPPPRGKPALINPVAEDPLDFLALDLRDTFEFVPIAPIGTEAYERAEYTLRVLRLNDRDYLIRARESAYRAFASQLYEYIGRRDVGGPRAGLDRIRRAIRRAHHQTVWAEMKRQHARIPPIRPLFSRAPEALTW